MSTIPASKETLQTASTLEADSNKIAAINQLAETDALRLFSQCCTSTIWVTKMVASRPFANHNQLFQQAEYHWQNLTEADYLEAFSGHPQIGDIHSLRAKYAHTQSFANHEQASIHEAAEYTLQALAANNQAYEQKFGFIFLVCATGKSAEQMLQLLQQRLLNDRQTELNNAATEQQKITRLRLEKLI
ncbi:2-oxo-4-hydroxy-4-carboxy-5-ureidoimidazoline decarboxylase [Endozoicomonas sp. SM1973]|uniref:2-oxo-4-hydroxy-4-carboxy-5-ureidoimidazoline decarboxylase n=1 Tax=Spartinivicinus marinus TaxID=2994442 RepID=A0A853I4M5_9GAMM|nr:2-oxo-4-hydroxy-4-carboxy-5-ureidoimidazoline decarboxylase [Spartinivicinus marinus]MCX4029520.1 2-oxo-4-hydroxy-4-carboxy-5-ureidoimidazoline decarboxylase [Spartinivicinus marinus]NYZ65094.1 2-oxo-4-hydroxy-4-carboxy-5-ureidoimidazoline decarboxylase [Spartinivicinus marinus]